MNTLHSPLKTLNSSSSRLELYPDRLVIQRLDWLSRLIGRDDNLMLAEIADVHIYASRFTPNRWLHLAIVPHHRKPVSLAYRIQQSTEVQDFKRALEQHIKAFAAAR